MDITSEHRTRFKSDLVDELARLVRERGFEWMPRLGQFRNAPTAGSPTCYFPSRTMPTESWWKGHCGIRIDAVEDTVYQYTNGFREFQPNSHTLITSTGRLEGS